MTRQQIQEQAGAHAVWMAAKAVMQACRAVNREDKVPPYNREGVETAAEILLGLFGTYGAAVKEALLVVAQDHDGWHGGHSWYLDAFIKELDVKTGAVKLRESNWVLES